MKEFFGYAKCRKGGAKFRKDPLRFSATSSRSLRYFDSPLKNLHFQVKR